MAATLDQVYAAVQLLTRKIDTLITEMGIIMSQQDEVNTDVAAIATATGDIAAELGDVYTKLSDEIAALKNANPALDLAGLDSLAGQVRDSLQPKVDQLAGLAPAPPA